MNPFYPPYYPKPFYPNYSDHKKNENPKKSSSSSSFGPVHFKNSVFTSNKEEPIFEIFGMELYLDDMILIGLLFLLYKEGVQDELLYITLLLLLIG